MLSRVAERVYWMARYLERAENTARLVNTYRELMLDLPRGVGVEWRQLVDIAGAEPAFSRRYRSAGERNVLKYILADPDNPGSVLSCLVAARENGRTTRDLMPSEGWECINELYLFGRRKFAGKALPARLHQALSEVVTRCQQIAGLLNGTMSHGDAYHFMRAGGAIERADMTTRILDVGSATLVASGDQKPRLENRLWMNVLRAVSGYQMYRQYVRRRIRGPAAVRFLLQDKLFPRALAHNLDVVHEALEALPRNDAALRTVARVRRQLSELDIDGLFANGLHAYLDELQLEVAMIHDQVAATWFVPELDEAV